MNKRALAVIIPLLACLSLVAQNEANIYRVAFLQPKAGSVDKFLEGVKEHNKKFHSKGIMKVRMYRVISGERSGWFVRTYGPMTWDEVDKFEADQATKAHSDHGSKVLRPYIEKRIGPSYWTPHDNLSYNRSSTSTASNMMRVSYTHVNPLMDGEYREMRKNIKEAHEKTGSKDSFTLGQLIHGGKLHTYAQFYPMDGWSDMSSGGATNLASRMNEVFGQGSWGRFMSKGQKVIYKRNDEMRLYMKDYSTR
tara:strand:- start:113 stop:865 length:753 start_codon:yes stop_codon:yes gene_type:complete